MSEPYLIAHLVNGAPAFDIATRMRCPICQGVGGHNVPDFETGAVTDYEGSPCHECDGEGYWWIIPTSGHRAYPFWSSPIEQCDHSSFTFQNCMFDVPPPPADHPDHYAPSAAPRGQGLISNLAERLGLIPKPPTITRR